MRCKINGCANKHNTDNSKPYKKYSCMCMDHFNPTDICGELQYQMAVKRTLKSNSIPCRKLRQTINNKNKAHQKQQKKNKEMVASPSTDKEDEYAFEQEETATTAELSKFEYNILNIKKEPFSEISEEQIELKHFENNAPSTSHTELQPSENNMLSFEILELVKDEPLTELEDNQMQTEITSSSNSVLAMNLETQVRILESEVKALKKENEKLKMDSFYLSKKYEQEICNLKKEFAISEFKRRKIREKLQELILKCKMDTL